MGVISRGAKNAFRNGVRSIAVIIILSIAISTSLVMLISLKSVDQKINSVKSSIGNFVTISPAGIRGFEGGGSLLTEDQALQVSKIDGVTKVVRTLTGRLAQADTSLQPSLQAGDFGQRQQRQQAQEVSGGTTQTQSRQFQMPIMVTGTSDLSITSNLNVSKLDLKSGKQFDASGSDNVAMVGADLASKNSLNVDSTFKAYGNDVKVIGVFDSGNQFANSTLIMPIKSMQNLSSQQNQINNMVVQVASIDQIDQVTQKIKDTLGDKADVVSSQDTSKSALAPLENIKTISLYSLIGSLIAGSIILLMTMIMIVRERRREIGVLKAIGSSNWAVTGQFAVEALVLTISSSIIGIILGALLSNPILKVLVNNAQTPASPAGQGVGRAAGRFGAAIMGQAGAIRSVTASVGIDIIAYGLLAAVVIAILGSVIPSLIIAKISPAEVMRAE